MTSAPRTRTLTARLSGATSQDVKLTVIAEAVSPAVANDFRLDGTTLTITAGQTRSGGTVTVTANDNTVNAPDKTVELSATVTAGPTGMTAPATQTLTITDDPKSRDDIQGAVPAQGVPKRDRPRA